LGLLPECVLDEGLEVAGFGSQLQLKLRLEAAASWLNWEFATSEGGIWTYFPNHLNPVGVKLGFSS